ncbi:cell wall hydrolase [Sinorhizobium meliloti]|uniref:cell wall hydrolase n=1 Tax=Rhizobium meliloti TaxID=382 RepID=UPI00299D1FE7
MVRAVVDTVTNRMASGQFPSTATGVLNQRRQFSKITGPSSLNPYGSVQQTPRAPAAVKSLVMDHVAARAAGAPPSIGGALNYANPHASTKNNMGWIGDMISAGAEKLGVGKNVHYHGNAPGTRPVGEYALSAESMPGGFVPRPTPRGGLFQAEGLGGILSAIDPTTPARVERQDLPSVTSPSISASGTAQAGVVPSSATAYADLGRNVTVGGVNPFAETAAPKMSLAEQYAAYGQGQAIARNMGLLAQDVAEFSPQLHPVQQAPQGDITLTDLPPSTEVQPSQVQAPQVEVPGPVQASPVAQPQYSAPQGGLLSPAEYAAVQQQQMNLSEMGPNRGVQFGNLAKGALTRIGGGILGGMLLGPLGAVAGGLLAPKAVSAITNKEGFPDKPKNTPKGDGRLNDYGRSVQRESRQFRDAVASGRGGLW